MGVTLPKPLMTKVEERGGNQLFRVGSCSINGYRENMEDAHIFILKDTWGFFGIFDGHVNEQCSAYLEIAFRDYLEKNPGPMTDEKMKEMAIQIDKEWLEKEAEGGSTGTFFLAHKEGKKVHLQVGNVGDSRVIVYKDGKCTPMTEDHKPNNEEERARIELFGGRVENNRVDGSLAISRAFGDRDYKQSIGDHLHQKVIAMPDVTHTTVAYGGDDFAVLCCDGVFESNFSNEEVIEFAYQKLKDNSDLATVAGMICEEAVNRGSRDNISCMIVQFKDGTTYAKPYLSVVPGPFNAPKSSAFVRLYKEMAAKGGMSVEEALEKRYNEIKDKIDEIDEEERTVFTPGPEKSLVGKDRTAWFAKFYEELVNRPNTGRNDQMARLTALQQQVGLPLPILLALMGENADLGP